MKKVKFLRAPDQTETDGFYDPEIPGLVIAKTTTEKPAWDTYSIYHQETGRYVLERTFRKRKDAEEALRRIGPLADWTKTVATLANAKLLAAVRSVDRDLLRERLEVT